MIAEALDTGYRLPGWLDATRLPRPVRRDRARQYEISDYYLPPQQVREVPEVVQQLHGLTRMAKLTDRALAEIVGVSHPTIAQARRGHAGALSRSVAQRQHLADTHMVVSRIYLLANRDTNRTAYALATPGADRLTALDHLRDGQVTKAYLTAMRALRPVRAGDMMVGSHPLDPRTARIAVPDED